MAAPSSVKTTTMLGSQPGSRASTPKGAQQLADAWVASLARQVAAVENPTGKAEQALGIVPIESAALPTTPVSPNTQRNLALGGQQLNAADRSQVEPQRIEAGLNSEVDLRLAWRVGQLALRRCGLEAAAFGDRGTPILGVHDVDALIFQVRVQLGDLLLGDLHLL